MDDLLNKHINTIFDIPSANNVQVGFATKKEYIQEDLTNQINKFESTGYVPNSDIEYSLSPALRAANELLNSTKNNIQPQEIDSQMLLHGISNNDNNNSSILRVSHQKINNAIPELNKLLDDNINPYLDNSKVINNQLNITNNNEKKYNIVNLFWLLHESRLSFKNNKEWADLLTISFNIDFGNLRLEFLKTNDNSIINDACLFLNTSTRLCNSTIYPSSAFKIVTKYNQFLNYIKVNHSQKIEPIKISCIEELINNTNEQWQYERPITSVYLMYENNIIGITLEIKSTVENIPTYYYSLTDWQIDCFIYSLEFIYKEGFNLKGKKTLM